MRYAHANIKQFTPFHEVTFIFRPARETGGSIGSKVADHMQEAPTVDIVVSLPRDAPGTWRGWNTFLTRNSMVEASGKYQASA